MDGPTHDHSDSDSGESWTLLENGPTYGDEAPEVLSEDILHQHAREHADIQSEKDEDTDGISIISDSDPESSPCDLNYVKVSTEESTAETHEVPHLTDFSTHSNSQNKPPVEDETDYLGDNVKFKTYVHKRNPKVATILDVIMLGTFIITAGVALGHLWSCKNECTTQTSVNKILSNLYKMQEENALLRSKLKEITEAASLHLTQTRKQTSNKPNKQVRCKKIFEEPILKNNKPDTEIKCVDNSNVNIIQEGIPEFEKEFLKDLEKMKDIYDQNKNWLDPEVKRQIDAYVKTNPAQINGLNIEQQLSHIVAPLLPLPDVVTDKSHRQINLEKQIGSTYYDLTTRLKPDSPTGSIPHTIPMTLDHELSYTSDQLPEKKITYADSLKADQPKSNQLKRSKRSINNLLPANGSKERYGKRKRKNDDTVLNLDSLSEDSIKKDDRYTPKTKHEKKKHDRQKPQKRQKRINKYEQWEMKGGYLKDFDEFSVTSSVDNGNLKPERKFLNADFENYVNKLIETENNASNKEIPKITKNVGEHAKGDYSPIRGKEKRKKMWKEEWYDQRAALRAKARVQLEQELFGGNTSNTAGWYFRRMHKREQCRALKDNTTSKKFTKRKMNFKMKR